MAGDYPHLSPYSYCTGNPVMLVELIGEDIWRINGKGEVVKHTLFVSHSNTNDGDEVYTSFYSTPYY